MARPIWTGSITFGLVIVPVKLYSAVREKEVRFHELHDEDGARLQHKRVCSADGKEVSYEHVVRGFEVAKDQYVVLTDDELAALDPRGAARSTSTASSTAPRSTPSSTTAPTTPCRTAGPTSPTPSSSRPWRRRRR